MATAEVEVQKIKVPIFKRILLYAAIVISIIFLLLGLAGIIGGWVINKPVTETLQTVLTSFETALTRVEEVSVNAGAALSETSTALGNADQRVQEAGEELADTNLILEVVSLIVGEEIEPNTDRARDSFVSIYDTVVAIEEAIAAINAIPFLNIEIPGSEEIASIRTGMEEIAVGVAELKDEIQQKREDRADNVVEAISAPINRLNIRVDEMSAKISDIETRLGLAIDRAEQVNSKIPLWIDIVSILNTLLFAWFIFSQGAVIVLCWRALHPDQVAAVPDKELSDEDGPDEDGPAGEVANDKEEVAAEAEPSEEVASDEEVVAETEPSEEVAGDEEVVAETEEEGDVEEEDDVDAEEKSDATS